MVVVGEEDLVVVAAVVLFTGVEGDLVCCLGGILFQLRSRGGEGGHTNANMEK